MVTNHAVTIPSANNLPDPSGTPMDNTQPSPSPDNPWLCSYNCTVVEHNDIVVLLWDGEYFSLPDWESNDPHFGQVLFTYDPPLV